MKRLLIANRGEIACRIIRSARALGITTIAIYSDADQGALHTRVADEAYSICGISPQESYLNQEVILRLARDAKIDAIHPGYGFLSENASFAAQCQKRGITFVGPKAEIIAQMGDKSAAKKRMQALGVPTVPGFLGENAPVATLAQEAAKIGFPVLIKANAGGGGRGMRIVKQAEAFAEACTAAQREALQAFGDDTVFLERFLEAPRHVEVQILADQHGQCFSFGDRDCSVQRRYQKVIEEAPAFNIPDPVRSKMQQVAVRAAQEIGYTNAGTFEFLLEGEDFYFLEMNTRLQVEHPVSEFITGFDLVKLQLQVAQGQRLAISQADIVCQGHAVEVRFYAEDPHQNDLPSSGQVTTLRWPSRTSKNLRIDSGLEQGDVLSSAYDPLIAKVITFAATRAEAISDLTDALSITVVEGITTNQDRLLSILKTSEFIHAQHNVYSNYATSLTAQPSLATLTGAALLLLHGKTTHNNPWYSASGWRMDNGRSHQLSLRCREQTYTLTLQGYQDQFFVSTEAQEQTFVMTQWPDSVRLHSPQGTVKVQHLAGTTFFDGVSHWDIALHEPEFTTEHAQHEECFSPTVGRVIQIHIESGQTVQEGASLVTLEAMKMEFTLKARDTRKIAAILCHVGQQVNQGDELLQVEEEEHATA